MYFHKEELIKDFIEENKLSFKAPVFRKKHHWAESQAYLVTSLIHFYEYHILHALTETTAPASGMSPAKP